METINKLLIGLVALSIMSILIISLVKNVTITKPLHPYNECLNIFIKESNKDSSKTDFDKAKSVCFELLEKKN